MIHIMTIYKKEDIKQALLYKIPNGHVYRLSLAKDKLECCVIAEDGTEKILNRVFLNTYLTECFTMMYLKLQDCDVTSEDIFTYKTLDCGRIEEVLNEH